MPLAEHTDMVKTIPPDRTDKAYPRSRLPWRLWCDRPIPNAHRSNAADEGGALDTISIANDISRRLWPAVCLGKLLGKPMGGRMRMPEDQNPYNSWKFSFIKQLLLNRTP